MMTPGPPSIRSLLSLIIFPFEHERYCFQILKLICNAIYYNTVCFKVDPSGMKQINQDNQLSHVSFFRLKRVGFKSIKCHRQQKAGDFNLSKKWDL